MMQKLSWNRPIKKTASYTRVQSAFKPVLQKITTHILKTKKDNVVSIYVYGSLSTGHARKKYSDADIFVVTRQKDDFKQLERVLSKKYKTYFSEVQILSQTYDNVYPGTDGWGEFTQLFCTHVCGKNIFPKSNVLFTKELTLDFMRDSLRMLKTYYPSRQAMERRRFAKLIIRGFYYVSLPTHKQWTNDLARQTSIASKMFPEHARIFSQYYDCYLDRNTISQKQLLALVSTLRRLLQQALAE